MRGRWLAEMAVVAALAVVGASVLRGRHEAILPELGVAGEVADARLVGTWRLVDFMPLDTLPPARRALVDRIAPTLVVTFDGETLRASAADGTFERALTASARGGRIEAVESSKGTRFAASYAEVGDELVVSVASGPWAGVARLRRMP
jgi:hypothetical protein